MAFFACVDFARKKGYSIPNADTDDPAGQSGGKSWD